MRHHEGEDLKLKISKMSLERGKTGIIKGKERSAHSRERNLQSAELYSGKVRQSKKHNGSIDMERRSKKITAKICMRGGTIGKRRKKKRDPVHI